MINDIKKYLHKLYFEIRYFSELSLIRSYCSSYKINSYTIYEDLSVDITPNIGIPNFEKVPFKINRYYGNINSNNLINLPKYVYGNVHINSSNKLNGLIGSPIEVHGSYILDRCNIKSLVGSPRKITGNFDLERNTISNLKGCPKYVGGDFNLNRNLIYSLYDLTTEIGGRLLLDDNSLPYELEKHRRYNRIIYKEYQTYKLWRSDGTFNKERFKILIDDINSGEVY